MVEKPVFFTFLDLQGIDFDGRLWYSHTITKAVTKTSDFGKIPREEATLVRGFCTPADADTTSEPQVGNGLPGAPVTASMSDGLWP